MPPRLVLFDFDGVLSRGDAFYQFVRHRYTHAPLRVVLALVTLPWLFLVLPFSWRRAVRTLVHVAFLGIGETRYCAAADAFAAQFVQRPRQFIRDGLNRLRQHQAAGDRVIVVTGCEHALVAAVLRQLGLRDAEIVASRLEPGWSGMRVQRHNIGTCKVRSLREHGVQAWQVAYGDSVHDIPMLKGAGEAVLVNGTPRLCRRVEQALGRPVVRVAWS